MNRIASLFNTGLLAVALLATAPAAAQDAVPQDHTAKGLEDGEDDAQEQYGPRPDKHSRDHRSDSAHVLGDHDWPAMAEFMKDFEMPDVPDMAPLMERFHVELGDPMRAFFHENRAIAELEHESRRIAREARRAEEAKKAELEAALRSNLQEIFDLKLELREKMVADLQERVEEEREKLERRREARREMIDRRHRMLMGEDDLLEW